MRTYAHMVLTLAILIVLIGCGPQQVAGENNMMTPPAAVNEMSKHTVTLYFSDKELMKLYRIERVIEVEQESDLPQATLEAWVAGSEYEELTALVPKGVVIEYVKDVEGDAHVSFSEEIRTANVGSSGEAAIMDQVALMMEQFGYKHTQFLINGEIPESLLGHMYTEEPYPAMDPNGIEWLEGHG